MKKLLSIVALLVLLTGISSSYVQAQAKFGHIDSNELLRIMPGRDNAQAQLEKHARELESQFVAMQTEFQTKYQDYLANEASLSDLIKQARQRELGNLQERIMEFQESAQEDLMKTENQLLSPIIENARLAIEEVSKENGYAYIFDRSTGTLLYAQPSDDIMPLVKKKLGIQ